MTDQQAIDYDDFVKAIDLESFEESNVIPFEDTQSEFRRGNRSSYLLSLAASLLGRGWPIDDVCAAMEEINSCSSDPLPNDQFQKKLASVRKFSRNNRRTDQGNAEYLLNFLGDEFITTPELKKMKAYQWDGFRYAPDELRNLESRTKEAIRKREREALDIKHKNTKKVELDHCVKSEDRIEATTKHFKRLPRVKHLASELDKDPDLFNTKAGTIHLPSGELREPSTRDLITKLSPVTSLSKTTRHFQSFLESVTNGDVSLMNYLQRIAGYCLSGHTSQQEFYVFYGPTASGKSRFLEALKYAWGDYSATLDINSLALRKRSGSSPSPDIARLRGKRLVISSENNYSYRMDPAFIKLLTGEDTIVARHMYGDLFDFKPQFKLLIATNELPIIPEEDEALWRRIRCIPFSNSIPESERDFSLGKKLQGETPAIISWALEGHQQWKQEGLTEPDCVKEATLNYRMAMDVVDPWIDECCEVGPEKVCYMSDLYRSFHDWNRDQGVPEFRIISAKSLGRKLTAKVFENFKLKGKRARRGIYSKYRSIDYY